MSRRVLALIAKDLRELGRSRGLLISMGALPMTMLPVPIFLVALAVKSSVGEASELLRFYRYQMYLKQHPTQSQLQRECLTKPLAC